MNIFFALLGVGLVGGSIYFATRPPAEPQASTNRDSADLASGSGDNPLSAVLGAIGNIAGVVRDVRRGDQETERARLRSGALQPRGTTGTAGESTYFGTMNP